jgi:3-oxoadipate enol-lactonase
MAAFERPGAKLYYEDTGEGPVVCFSHGILMDADMFAPQIEALRGEFRCVSWDERGHGRSESEGSFSYWDLADDLLALMDHVEAERALLVGMSQGGFLSLRAALRAPERVAGLFLIDTQAGPESDDVVPGYEALLEEWRTNGPQMHIVEVAAASIVDPAPREPWIEKWMAASNDYPVEPMRCLMSRDDITERLGEITAPALVVHGDADPAIPMDLAEALCNGLSNCEGLIPIAGGGHASNLSHPDDVNKHLLDFCHRHAPQPTTAE